MLSADGVSGMCPEYALILLRLVQTCYQPCECREVKAELGPWQHIDMREKRHVPALERQICVSSTSIRHVCLSQMYRPTTNIHAASAETVQTQPIAATHFILVVVMLGHSWLCYRQEQ